LNGPGSSAPMTDLEKTLASVHKRLSAMREEIEREFGMLFDELEQVESSVENLKSAEGDQDKRLKQLAERAEGQSELIETLTQEAEEARSLRGEVRERELEIEKLNSELESKSDLVKALRRQASESEQAKATAKQRDKKIFEQQHQLDRKQKELDRATAEIAELKSALESEDDRSADETVVDGAEIDALKAELDARKSMIKSLKADAKRAESLESQLDAKTEAVDALEDAIDQHAKTIAELRRSVDAWKSKYQAAKGEKLKDKDRTMTELPAFTDTEVEVLKGLERDKEDAPAATVAIDMRGALKEARRNKARAKS
jgi:chromosome segregation ATPase